LLATDKHSSLFSRGICDGDKKVLLFLAQAVEKMRQQMKQLKQAQETGQAAVKLWFFIK
jgi:hypothetical protein